MLTRIWVRVRERLSGCSAITYVGAALALALLVVLGLVVLRLFGAPMGPNRSSSMVTPTPGLSAQPTPTSSDAADVSPIESPVPTPKEFVVVKLHLPLVIQDRPSPTAVPKPTKALPTPTPVDFAAVRQELQAQGKDLAYVKLGFHLGSGGTARGLGEYLRGLADAGVPAVIKSADSYGVCAEALRASPDHVTVFRMTQGTLEHPNYDLPPGQAAAGHWEEIKAALPPEFDKRTWLEVINEPGKHLADWLGWFSYHTAELALRDGYRFAAFGWSTGEPEPEHWQTPGMLAFLQLASQHPDRIAVALHEYSLEVGDIGHDYPWLIGRFQMLFRICDEHGIERPTVLITEWGWEYVRVPPVEQAMKDIAWAAELYAAYPEVRGAAIWYLGGGYGGIAGDAQRLIKPLWHYAWSEYFVIEPGHRPTDPAQFAP